YSYLLASVASTFWLTFWQSFRVGRARKAAGIPYPQAYAEAAVAVKSQEAQIFNCTQRAHQNTLEWLPQLYASAFIVGLKYPIPAAIGVASWTFGRVLYTIGYSSGDPKKVSISNAM
ncbi:membrane-associated proteins in eicosanoid and glutathione metabolism, partial [Irpex lacteus]